MSELWGWCAHPSEGEVKLIHIKDGIKLVYQGKELMLPGTVLTVKNVRTYLIPNDKVFETMVTFHETGESEYNIRFFQP